MWPRLLAAGLGIWLMAASSVLGYTGTTRNADVIAGALIASTAIMAATEVLRPLRWGNTAIGAWLVVAPWLLGYGSAALVNSTVVGLLVIGASLVRGPIESRFGGGWSALFTTGGGADGRRP